MSLFIPKWGNKIRDAKNLTGHLVPPSATELQQYPHTRLSNLCLITSNYGDLTTFKLAAYNSNCLDLFSLYSAHTYIYFAPLTIIM